MLKVKIKTLEFLLCDTCFVSITLEVSFKKGSINDTVWTIFQLYDIVLLNANDLNSFVSYVKNKVTMKYNDYLNEIPFGGFDKMTAASI